MKKKTSLWISGITTVAMLAVAVGSFAAWDKLDAKDNTLDATSGSPAVLDANTTTAENIPLLVPADSITMTDKESNEITIGTITATLKTEDASSPVDKSSGATIKCAADIAAGTESGSQITNFTVTLVPKTEGENSVVFDGNGTATEIKANEEYTVKVKYKDGIDYSGAASLKGQPLHTNLTVTAEKKAAV